jgi:hypothetical protein
LRTNLSTKDVQNLGAERNSRREERYPPMPCFYACGIFLMESTVFPRVKCLAHSLIHKRCAERFWWCVAAKQPRTRPGRRVCQGMLSLQAFIASAGHLRASGGRSAVDFMKISAHASFLRSRKIPIRINGLACTHCPSPQSYPQKVCRTILADQLATRYIAAFVVRRFPSKFRSSFCSPFFKPQAGLSGRC